MKNIVITGYPKSGNTWITRLVAELIQCPVEGFWQSQHDEIASEGSDRNSPYACYKSHHQLYELESLEALPWKIIYVIRDPRDIVFSGMPYFYRGYLRAVKHRLFLHPVLSRIYYHLGGKQEMKRVMIRTILEGDSRTHRWCKVSWAAHVAPFVKRPDILKITYRDMLSDPVSCCQNILEYLSVTRTAEEISNAIQNQSFNVVSEKFRNSGQVRKAKFLRAGRRGYWRSQLSPAEQKLFADALGTELQDLGFTV